MQTGTVEHLESRRLLAAQIVAGELVATGTAGADSIEFRRVGTDDVQVTFWLGASSTPVSRQVFDLDDFDSARAEGLEGNDEIWVASGGFIPNLTMNGGAGDDFLWGGSAGETFNGAEGSDDVFGNGGNDRMFFGLFNPGDVDTASGGAGDDDISTGAVENLTADGGAGNDDFGFTSSEGDTPPGIHFIGGTGNDEYFHNSGAYPVDFDGGAGIDGMISDGFSDLDLRDFPTVENVLCEGGNVIGNDLDNTIILNFGTARGGNGNDTLSCNTGIGADVEFYGEDGNDTLIGTRFSNEILDGGAGNDTIHGNGDDRTKLADGSADQIDGGSGTDTVTAGGRSTILNAELFPEMLRADILEGSIQVRGSLGHDSIEVRSLSANQLRITIWTTSSTPVFQQTFQLDALVNSVTVAGYAGDDEIWVPGAAALQFPIPDGPRLIANGNAGNDFIFGSANWDQLTGGPGNDELFGNAGDDELFADDGAPDTVNGGAGTDSADVDNQDTVSNVEDAT